MRSKSEPHQCFVIKKESEIGKENKPKNEQSIEIHNDQNDQENFRVQFKHLYAIDNSPGRKQFLDSLFTFMINRGTRVCRIPIMGKQDLDLYELYRLVVARGGLVEVINKKIWREIGRGLNIPSSNTSAAFTLRTQYMKYLYPYECEKEHLSTPEELQQAIDGNRREGRRSSYGNHLDMLGSPVGPGNSMVNGNGGSSLNLSRNHSTSPLSLANRNLNSGASSGEDEDNGSLHSLSLNPLLALASAQAQAEALNLEVKPNINGPSSIHLNSNSHNINNNNSNNNQNNSSSSLTSQFNLHINNIENESSINMNGRDNNNNNNNGRERGETNERMNNNNNINHTIDNRKDLLHDSSGIDLSTRHSSSSSSSSTSNSNVQGTKRYLSDDERLLINAGIPSAHIKIANRDGRSQIDSSLLLSLEINNIIYSGILYPRSLKQ